MGEMTGYCVPAGPGESEYDEKRSRFLGHVWPVETEEEARSYVEQMKKTYHDARHNCWCYRLAGGVERYSDDGEPQGTAGQPMLAVFQKEEITNAVCVVTRYFGGVLLGSGGLVRAYTQSAKDALEDAGRAVVRTWLRLSVRCPYALYERVSRLAGQKGGETAEVDYAEDVTLTLLMPPEAAEDFQKALTELSAGSLEAKKLGEIKKSLRLKQDF